MPINKHTERINQCLVYGWLLIVSILFVSYAAEVVKGERDLSYLVIFMVITVLPAMIVFVRYLKDKGRYTLRYEYVAGYFLMYAFVMFTGSTTMVFSYILPMLSLLVLFHQPRLILQTGLAAMFLNLLSIVQRGLRGKLNVHNTKDVEIQVALVFLCFSGSYLAAKIYDTIQKQSEESSRKLYEQNQQMQHITMQTIMTIANTIDAKDDYTRGHSRRVSEYAAAIGREMGMKEQEIEDLRFIGLLHDIGKIGIPDALLNKPGKLTSEEYQVMKDHTLVGAEILKDIGMIQGLDIGAKYHHERYDGKGYPEGLCQTQIPFIARIIAVADAYDAMSSNRVYRKHLPYDRILEELKNGVGTQWDPDCATVMIRLIEEDRLPKINPDMETETLRQTTTLLSRVIDYAGSTQGDIREKGTDLLTGAYGRDKGAGIVQNMIDRLGQGCLFLFDIDHFHNINHVEGFVVGDEYLQVLAQTIRDVFDTPVLTRTGSDEFAAYLDKCKTEETAIDLTNRFYAELRKKAEENPALKRLAVSMGITFVATAKDKLHILYGNLEKALYVAKQRGGNTYYIHRIYQESPEGEISSEADLKQLVKMIRVAGDVRGGFNTSYPEFGRMYEFLNSLASRTHQNVLIILFTVQPVEGIKPELEERDRIMSLMQKAITESIRNVDVMTRYSSTQYAVLFMNLSLENKEIVTNRIMRDFLRFYDQGEFTIHYDAADLS